MSAGGIKLPATRSCLNRSAIHLASEIAELLDVTEEYLQECIDCYRDKYGVYTEVDNYVIYFIPNLAVMEKI